MINALQLILVLETNMCLDMQTQPDVTNSAGPIRTCTIKSEVANQYTNDPTSGSYTRNRTLLFVTGKAMG